MERNPNPALEVEAVKEGYYGRRLRKPGTASAKFCLFEASEFSHNWMRAIGWEPPPRRKPAAPAFAVNDLAVLVARIAGLEARVAELEGAKAQRGRRGLPPEETAP